MPKAVQSCRQGHIQMQKTKGALQNNTGDPKFCWRKEGAAFSAWGLQQQITELLHFDPSQKKGKAQREPPECRRQELVRNEPHPSFPFSTLQGFMMDETSPETDGLREGSSALSDVIPLPAAFQNHPRAQVRGQEKKILISFDCDAPVES